ncbi:hypothetical protein DL764_003539 [Monosporascus ibericus]|uniref:Peptidase A1 domain-containing protein n=1 Tax=Monosporascus ibericus TaxID=155417 RepID=A0A4Q4TGU1_9PEZI|nr:hypothetical protein DL764_003539 [Monosporascus ibericus]
MRVLPALVAVGCAASFATAQRVVSMGIGKTKRPPPLHKRSILQELNNNLTGGGYYAEVSVGTPPQTVRLIVDTGSSDVWVLDSDANLCTSSIMQEEYGGGCIATFDPPESSTYTALSDAPFQIVYLDGSGANGTYFQDHINIGGTEIESLQMGLAEDSTINSGLLGIGYSANVAARDPYPTIIDLLEEQGLIAIRAYSLWLNAYSADMGTILFGGVDTEKFLGELIAVPVLPDGRTGIYHSFAVALSSLTLNYTDGSSDTVIQQPVPVILDSGTTLTYLPPRIADYIYNALGAVDDTWYTGLVYIDCAYLRNESGLTFDFQFGGDSGPLVRVPVNEVVLDNVMEYVEMGLPIPPGMPFADDVCSFGIHPGDQGIYLLGDTFLRSAYVVYDLENHEVAMAQANVNTTRSNVLEITRDGIPDVSGVASQATAEQTATGLPGPGGELPTVTVTASPDPDDGENAGPKTLTAPPAWEVAAVAAVAALSGLMGVGLFVL